MNVAGIVFGTIFSTIGVLFVTGKIHPHLSVWKNMSEEEKSQINIIPLCRNIGEVILLSGIIFLLKGLWTGFENHMFTGAMIAWLIVAGLDVYFIGKSSRYKNIDKNQN